ncbi:hypothetical protein I4U23_022275 [Adineta vaga]|nr:hypothetical protein I4U23_022275 [Adineta vaga]
MASSNEQQNELSVTNINKEVQNLSLNSDTLPLLKGSTPSSTDHDEGSIPKSGSDTQPDINTSTIPQESISNNVSNSDK